LADIDIQNPSVPVYRGEDWAELVSQSNEFFGADLEGGDNLIGVPFAIVRMTFRPGDFARRDFQDLNGDVVFLDLIIGPQEEIDRGVRRKRITEPVMVEAGEHLGINEGGTGVYRQMVQYLEAAQMIRLPNPDGPLDGKYGESRLDAPVRTWQYHETAVARLGERGEPTLSFNVRLLCPRGLRASDYINEVTKTGHTRYIA
jgi:hypothetical protein